MEILELAGKKLIERSDLIAALRVNKRTLQMWTAQGKLPVLRIGKRCWYNLDHIENLIETSTQ